MKITGFETTRFTAVSHTIRDAEGHGHPGPAHDVVHTLFSVNTDAGVKGHTFGGSADLAAYATELLKGENPLDRERIWQRLRQFQRMDPIRLHDRNIGVVDVALWDFAGQLTGLPVSKLLGGYREKVAAYASTMCGDDIPGGLDTPESYAKFAVSLVSQGYKAVKLHSWMAPLGPDPRHDVAACRAVREAVGPDVELMLDCNHDYSREDALYIGRELEKLDFLWFEEPMNEDSMSSYIWLSQQLNIPICGPEVALGKNYSRAEWILRGGADIGRYDIHHAGITPMMKAVHLCESFGMSLEVHGPGAAHLQVLGAMGIPGRYYERGLLHPHEDYESRTPWLLEIVDPVDADGNVAIPQGPGLGHKIDWDYIREHTVK